MLGSNDGEAGRTDPAPPALKQLDAFALAAYWPGLLAMYTHLQGWLPHTLGPNWPASTPANSCAPCRHLRLTRQLLRAPGH